MAIVTLIFGLIIGFIAGMIVAAGSWRNALTRVGLYAVNAGRPPVAANAAPTPAPLPMTTRTEDPQ